MTLTSSSEQQAVIDQLMALNFHAFLRLISELLDRMGYEDIRLSSRTGFVGRNRDGGFDLAALKPVPGGQRRVLIQVKQYAPERAVYSRTVNELRGVCLQHVAAEAILITTSGFSPSVLPAQVASAALVPVRLIDGQYLADLCALYRVGMRKEQTATGTRFGLDQSYFARLEQEYKGVARAMPGERKYIGVVVAVTPRKRRS